MKRTPIIMYVTILTLSIYSVAKNSDSKNDLSGNYEQKLGDAIAVFMNSTLDKIQKVAGYDAPVIVTYKKDKDVLSVIIFGSRNDTDNVKDSMNDFRKKVFSEMTKIVSNVYGVTLGESDYIITYINKNSKKKKLQFYMGKYIIP